MSLLDTRYSFPIIKVLLNSLMTQDMLTREEIRTVRRDITGEAEPLPLMFGALADTGRYRIFRMLLTRHDLCVTDVAHVLGISVPAASQQLRIMELSGLVRKERMGQMTCYGVRTDNPLVKSIITIINRSS